MKPNCGNEDINIAGFVKFMRSLESQELLANDPLAFALLAVIALRARWRSASFNVHDLKLGEALVGDYDKMGFTRRQYRTRLARLAKLGLIVIRPTRKGTVVALTSSDVFDINLLSNENLTSEQSAKQRPSKQPTASPMKQRGERPTERPTGGQQAANKRPLTNNDKKEKNDYDQGKAVHNPIRVASSNAESGESSFVGRYQNQDQPVQSHVKWQEFAAWCRKQRDRRGQPGQPTESGFWKWLCGQKPQWRNKVRKNFEVEGYVLDGKFLTEDEANQCGAKNSELLTKFRKATKLGDKIYIVDVPRVLLKNLRNTD